MMMLMHVMVGTRVMRYRGLIVAVEDRRDGADDKTLLKVVMTTSRIAMQLVMMIQIHNVAVCSIR